MHFQARTFLEGSIEAMYAIFQYHYQLTSKIGPKRPNYRTLSFLMVSFQEKNSKIVFTLEL